MKLHNIAKTQALEEQNKMLLESNAELRRQLYGRRIITNPILPERRRPDVSD